MRRIACLLGAMAMLGGCAAYRQLHVTSEPAGVRVSRSGAVVGTTPFDMKVRAGDVVCTPGYWAFSLEAESPYPGQAPIQKYIEPCSIPSQSTVHFNFFPPTSTPAPSLSPSEVSGVKTGTGFVVDNSGLVLTAYHVVEGATDIAAQMADGAWVSLSIRAFARSTDLAVLGAAHALMGALPIAHPNSVGLGDEVFTIGFPVVGLLGDQPKYSNGSISSLAGLQGDNSYLQVSVPVQPGNSGGPLCNERGEVVGVLTSTAAVDYFLGQTGTLPQNVNWAVKIEYALPLLGAMAQNGSSATATTALERTRDGVCLIVAK